MLHRQLLCVKVALHRNNGCVEKESRFAAAPRKLTEDLEYREFEQLAVIGSWGLEGVDDR